MAFQDDLRAARRRALRAAQVVTLGFALAGGPAACSSRNDPPPLGPEDSGTTGDGAVMIDSGPPGEDSGPPDEDSGTMADSGTDSGSSDAGDDGGTLADAGDDGGVIADASTDGSLAGDACVACAPGRCAPVYDCICPPGRTPADEPDCCADTGGFWVEGGGCAIPGPFVPPRAFV